MQHQITVRNVNDAWEAAKSIIIYHSDDLCIERPSRNGPVIEAKGPVITEYLRPAERVLFDPVRNCNPFFHMFEALWMLAGRNDVAWIAQFNPRMAQYSDDGETFHGAYGYRWRYWFDMDGGAEDDFADQLLKAIRMLKADRDDRRVVVGMWDAMCDLERPDCKDLPCNTHIYFYPRQNQLTMTVCCRSNDIVFGCYGANAVHLSMLQEYVAAGAGYPMGSYYQISNSWHAYKWAEKAKLNGLYAEPYAAWQLKLFPMVKDFDSWDEELRAWMQNMDEPQLDEAPFRNPFFPCVVQPMYNAWLRYKDNDLEGAYQALVACEADDWRIACQQWIQRIMDRRQQRTAQTV